MKVLITRYMSHQNCSCNAPRQLLPMVERSAQEYLGKTGDILEEIFFVVKGRIEARHSKPGKQVCKRISCATGKIAGMYDMCLLARKLDFSVVTLASPGQ